MEIAIKSDVGQRRTLNEDAAGYFLNTKMCHLSLFAMDWRA